MAHIKAQKRNSNKPSLNKRAAYWKVQLQKSSSLYSVLYEIKANLPALLTREIVVWLQSTSSSIEHLLGAPFPRTNSEWKSTRLGRHANYDREIFWCYLRLLPYVANISEFIKLAKSYEQLFIRANYEECLNLLELVEEKFGLSLWLVKRRIHTLQLARGLEEQKTYAGSLSNDTAFRNGIIPYLVHYVSYRAEASVSPQRFKALYKELLSDNSIPEIIHPYLTYHIVSQYFEDSDMLARVLNYESSGSVIDYYETLVSTSQMCAASNDALLSKNTLEILDGLRKATQDDRLLRIVVHCGSELDRATHFLILDDPRVYKAFIAGDNDRVISIASKSIEGQEEVIPGDILLYVLASMNNSENSKIGMQCIEYPIIDGLSGLLSGKSSKSVHDELYRFVWAIEGSATSHLLRSAIISNDNPVPDNNESASFRYSLIGMGKYHPIQSWWSPSFQSMLEMMCLGSNKNAIIENECQHTCDICSTRDFECVADEYRTWECARQLIRKGLYDEVLEHARYLAISTHPFYQKQSIILTIICLFELGEIEKCVETVTDFWLLYPHSSESLPLIKLMASITPEIKTAMAGNISYPIFCHIFTMVIDSGKPFYRSYAAEDFITNFRLSRPSQLRDILEHFPREKLLLFLHDICLEKVMDTWIEFNSSEEVALERVEVCKLLTDLCPENKDTYQREIRGIMQRLTIRKRITEVEKSKVYVDTESVKVVAKRTLSEDYERYIAFRRSGISPEHQEIIEHAKNSLMSGNVQEFLSLKFPRNEMSALLDKMVLHLRAEFMTSSQHGLDGYLSVRIRHGTLEGQLRSAFETEYLLTKKSNETDEYSSNQYWLDRLAYEDPRYTEMADQAFREFSSQFDQLVHRIKKNWLQIKIKPEDPGRIDLTLLTPEIDYIATRINEGTTLDEFMDLVLDYFVSDKLVPSLKNMRLDIQTEIKPLLNNLLTQLQTSIEEIGPVGRIQELRAAIGRVRPSSQNTLDRIAGWLKLAKTENKEPFSLDEVISISESSVQASCPEFSVVRNIDAYLGGLLLVANLPSFVDILYIIFDNIVRRSGLPIFPKGTVNAVYDEPYLRICVENDVTEEARTEAKRIRVNEIKMAVKSQPFSKSVSKEGGTGFFKVQKILNHDFRPPTGQLEPALDFGFSEENKFYVCVTIPIHSQRRIEVDD